MAGCQSLPPKADASPAAVAELVESREAALGLLNEFSFSGGLGIWTSEQSIPARIVWRQSVSGLHLSLSGPLGLGDMKLEQSADEAILKRGNEAVAAGASADQVVQQGLGLAAPIPIEQLKQWVRGLPGDAESVVRDERGRLASLRYRDATGTRWEARFKRYTDFNDLAVPSLITASGGSFSVRLVLKNWKTSLDSVVPESNESNNRLSIPRR